MENDTGSWWLFTGLVQQLGWPWMTLVHSSYADHLQFIKNKAHSDSLKTPSKLHDKLDTSEINQIANSIT